MKEENKKEPPTGGEVVEKEERDKQGKFVEGHTKVGGMKKGHKFSLVSILKELLQKIPEGQKESNAKQLIAETFKKAMAGDTFMLRDIINRIDGMPKQNIGFDMDDVLTELKITIHPPKIKKDESQSGINNNLSEDTKPIPDKKE